MAIAVIAHANQANQSPNLTYGVVECRDSNFGYRIPCRFIGSSLMMRPVGSTNAEMPVVAALNR